MVKSQKHSESTENDTRYKDKEPEVQSQQVKKNKAIQPVHPDTQNLKQLNPRLTDIYGVEVVNGIVVIKKEEKK